MVWNLFLNGPEPVGYNPAIVPTWTNPTAPTFAALRLEPWRLRLFAGTVLMGQGGTVLNWRANSPELTPALKLRPSQIYHSPL